MAGISGPTRLMPGMVIDTKPGMGCDQHPDRSAVKRLVGEVDSFGAEYHDMCQECLDKFLAEKDTPREQYCDWCKKYKEDCTPFRDREEGACGPVYTVCSACRSNHLKYVRENY